MGADVSVLNPKDAEVCFGLDHDPGPQVPAVAGGVTDRDDAAPFGLHRITRGAAPGGLAAAAADGAVFARARTVTGPAASVMACEVVGEG